MNTRIDQLVQIRELASYLGQSVRLSSNEELISLALSPESCSLLIRRYRAREYYYQTHYLSASLVLVTWTRAEPLGWSRSELAMCDPLFTPWVRYELGWVRNTPNVVHDRLEWEALAYRPGNDARLGSRDSFARCTDGGSTESPMDTDWTQHRETLLRSSSDVCN